MKRIFPVITILMVLSLLGLILFQFLWIKSAHDYKRDQLMEHLIKATREAGAKLSENTKSYTKLKRPDFIFPSDIPFELRKKSIIRSYNKEEIKNIIQYFFKQNDIEKVPFEFAITENSLSGETLMTENFHRDFTVDSATSINYVVPLTGGSGTALENLTNEELLVVLIPNQQSEILKQIGWFIVGAVLFTLIILAAFYLTVKTILKQKKLSEIKNDFINNMTHEFKTPLATISLAVDALKNEKVVGDREKSAYFSGIIKEENVRMNKQVEAILQAALLDKRNIQFDLQPAAAHQLIQNAINNIQLPLQEKNGTLEVKLNATNDHILANDVHFTNLTNNLLDNALKYSKENPHITLTTCTVGKQFRMKVEDNGIGMSKDTLNRIFEKFFRAHTGNVHDVKGFGLGLSYVKKMVEAHNGNIKVESTIGKGSTFTINIPLHKH